jgi:hypothetical protein
MVKEIMSYPMLLVFALVVNLDVPVQTLNGDARSFPRDAIAPRSVFVVTFSKAASEQGAIWTRKLQEVHEQLAAAIFQVAILEDVPKLFRSFVISAMAKGIPEALHDHFWIAVTGGNKWQECVGAERAPNKAHVFVLDQRERIVWRGHGECSAASIQELLSLPQPTR